MGTCCSGAAGVAASSRSEPKLPEKLSLEEEIISANEKKLAISNLHSKEIIKSLKAECVDDLLSMPQMKRFYHELQMPESDLTTPDSGFFKILTKVKDDRKLYSVKKLSLLGILVGKGSSQEKAVWLFKQFDKDASETIDAIEVQSMLTELADVAINIIPNVAKGDEPGLMTKEEIESYRTTLVEAEETAILELMRLICTSKELSSAEFVSKICDPSLQLKSLLSSSGLRTFVRKYSSFT